MGIVLAVKKNNVVCIASDSMYLVGGGRKLTSENIKNHEKILAVNNSYVGISDHPIWIQVLKNYFKNKKKPPLFDTTENIFSTLLELHGDLKSDYYLTDSDDEDLDFESSRFESIIANSNSIFKTYEQRSIQEFIRFTAIGSGSSYAYGALHALYDRLESAEEIARAALHSVIEFDDSSGFPIHIHQVSGK